MARTLIFKKEHEEKLKKLQVKTEFSNELRKSFSQPNGRDGLLIKNLKTFMELQKNMTWEYFIGVAFKWERTSKGEFYWKQIKESKN